MSVGNGQQWSTRGAPGLCLGLGVLSDTIDKHTGIAVGEQFILSKRSTASSTDCDSLERVEGHGRR